MTVVGLQDAHDASDVLHRIQEQHQRHPVLYVEVVVLLQVVLALLLQHRERCHLVVDVAVLLPRVGVHAGHDRGLS